MQRRPLLSLSLLAAAAGMMALSACAPGKQVLLKFDGSPDDALVTINDRYIGKLGRLEKAGVMLPPGEYRITVEQVGYFPQDQLVVIKADAPAPPLQVKLTQIPD